MVADKSTTFTFEDDYEFRRGAEGAVAHQGSERATESPIDCCDACGEPGMQLMSGCKRLCRKCGFLRSCTDTV